MPLADPLLRVDALSFRHAGGGGVGPLTFDLAPGERALLLGPSGSGKTTMVHLIAGLLPPSAGRVVLAGTDMGGLDAPGRDDLRRRTTGLVFQTLRLVSALDVRSNLALARRLAGRPADPGRIMGLLERLGIAHRAGALPRQLSQGEAQRAAIARALVTEPQLLIADEPTSALDDANAAAAIDLLEEVAAGAALLVVTHDRRLMERFPRALLLDSTGRLDDPARLEPVA